MELITDPSILLLDEPTSGLDSKSAASVVEILLKLARDRNRTIICTIHSPSSHIFQMFDDLMVRHTPPARHLLEFTSTVVVCCVRRVCVVCVCVFRASCVCVCLWYLSCSHGAS
jgi:ABC-type taurine transport system ATPase subunit